MNHIVNILLVGMLFLTGCSDREKVNIKAVDANLSLPKGYALSSGTMSRRIQYESSTRHGGMGLYKGDCSDAPILDSFGEHDNLKGLKFFAMSSSDISDALPAYPDICFETNENGVTSLFVGPDTIASYKYETIMEYLKVYIPESKIVISDHLAAKKAAYANHKEIMDSWSLDD